MEVEERAHPGRLAACRRAVLEGLARAGVDTGEEERRAFRPHVSVARPRGRGRLPAEFAALDLGLDWNPDGVALLESCLTVARPSERTTAATRSLGDRL